MKLIFASNNKGKVKEVKDICKNIEIFDLNDLNLTLKIDENGKTFCENAYKKAKYVYDRFKCPVFADDSGLEVSELNFEPGVYSSRYAGSNASDEDNINKLLAKMKHIKNREAQFVCCICLIINDKPYYFEGILKGRIATEKRGQNGFGYDPIFIPDGYNLTLAELSIKEKNLISHRYKAIKKMIEFIERLNYLQ